MSDFDTAIDTDVEEVPTSYSSSTPGIALAVKVFLHLVAELVVVKKQLHAFA